MIIRREKLENRMITRLGRRQSRKGRRQSRIDRRQSRVDNLDISLNTQWI